MRHPVFQGDQLRDFSTRRALNCAMYRHRSLSMELGEKLWEAPDELMAVGEPLQDKERCLVVRLTDGQDSLILKRHNWGGVWKTFCKSLRVPQARQSFLDGVYLAAAGVRTPKPLALVEHKLGPFGRRSYLLTEYVHGTSLYRLMRFEAPSLDIIEHVIDQVGQLCSRLDGLRISHNDLKPENLMIDGAGQVWLIDLEKMRRHSSVEPARVRLLEDLKRLLHPRNWRENREAAELFRKRLSEHSVVIAALGQVRPSKHPLIDSRPFDRGQENKLSVLVVSPKDVQNLRACVETFRDIADQIVVADRQPTASMRALIDQLGCQLLEPTDETEGAAQFHNRALGQTKHPWVLVVEGDERVSPDLAKEIQCLLTESVQEDAYRITRRRVYLGHVSKFGPFRGESPARLFRRERGKFVDHRVRVRLEVCSKQPGRLKSKLIYLFCWHVTDYVQSINEGTTRVAKLRYESGERPRLIRALFRATRRFARDYLLRHAYLDGRVGLQMSILSAFTILVTEAKLWELRHARRQHAPLAEPRPALTGLFQRVEPSEQSSDQGSRYAA